MSFVNEILKKKKQKTTHAFVLENRIYYSSKCMPLYNNPIGNQPSATHALLEGKPVSS